MASRLFCVQDKSCKTRIVAMLDSYSQVALRPVHNMLEQMLRKFKTDFTFNHIKGVRYIRDHVGGVLSSIDLSNATDTIPVDLGLRLILDNASTLIDDKEGLVADLKSVMTLRDFDFDKKKYRYLTGQPMGSYGSFPMLAITNHLLLQMARVMSGFPVKTQAYAIVGDDIVISGKKIALNYTRLLAALNVPVNQNKLVEGVRTFEFCRRIVRDGKIASVPSWNVIYQAVKSKDPTPLVMIYQDYGYDHLTYPLLVRIFSRRSLRNMLAIHPELNLVGQPKVERIPNDVALHADRILGILDSIRNPGKDLVTDDPYLRRLNYEKTIVKMFASYIKKHKPWIGVAKCKANSFYLGYRDVYLDRKKIIRRVYRHDENTRSKRVRHLCMTKRSQ